MCNLLVFVSPFLACCEVMGSAGGVEHIEVLVRSGVALVVKGWPPIVLVPLAFPVVSRTIATDWRPWVHANARCGGYAGAGSRGRGMKSGFVWRRIDRRLIHRCDKITLVRVLSGAIN